jgi:hypothetical protein
MDIDARAFGQLEGEVKALAQTLETQNLTQASQMLAITKTLEAQNVELAAIKTTLSEARGGWKTLVFIGGAAASAATGLTWVLQHITFRAGP